MSGLAGAQLPVAPPAPDSSKALPWVVWYFRGGGVPYATFVMRFYDTGLVRMEERYSKTITCFSASQAQLADANTAIKELNLSAPPKPVPKGRPVMPSGRRTDNVTVSYRGQDYDLADDYKPDSAKKRLSGVVSRLVGDGEARIADARQGKPPHPGSIPCPAESKPQ